MRLRVCLPIDLVPEIRETVMLGTIPAASLNCPIAVSGAIPRATLIELDLAERALRH